MKLLMGSGMDKAGRDNVGAADYLVDGLECVGEGIGGIVEAGDYPGTQQAFFSDDRRKV